MKWHIDREHGNTSESNSTLPISHLKHPKMNDSRECYSGSDSQKTEESTLS